ncbi:maleylpyruvate isomerase family mycothiol-dependent enzyme [Glycomyces salinus]|uniref:maleylpyruvate isomerase family mycothiol-dependent enzyme n=1 Tax=Glycomyces salinus TaxID=980294 RepID=UPI0018EE18EF|nr:maleylpyruvate isomerase family mycothiol-dependent enzyme [Glycomyces salinus]
MDFPSLRTHLAAEADALKAAAARADPDARVPSCPDWTATDLLDHVTEVYDHKTQCMRLLREPEDGERLEREGGPAERFDAALAGLLAEFDARHPEDLSHTWYGPDQTVGFWIRRMAAETVVHRADAELAAVETIGPVDPGLGADAADEMLRIMVEWESRVSRDELAEVLADAAGLVVAVDAGERAWTVRVGAEAAEVADGIDADAQATVSGTPGEVLMWLWRRLPAEALTVEGDAAKSAALHAMLAEFGQ